MDVLILARLQFALTIIYHFFFVPLTIGLSLVVAILESIYVSTGKEIYKRLTKFWGKLFLINFAVGVVTGIVQEFQFGMSWAEYSRFVGDVFGTPLAIEALLAFFLESTFLGIWIFGWDRISKGLHLATMWLVVLGSNLSAIWILIANGFMQHPAGYTITDGRAVLTNFSQLIFNLPIFTHYPHAFSASLVTAAFFMLGVSAYHLLRRNETDFFRYSFRMAAIIGVIGTIAVGVIGDFQGKDIRVYEPMKVASLEALFNTENPASLSVLTIANPFTGNLVLDLRIPKALSLLMYDRLSGEVMGINQLQAQYEQQYGPGNYTPPPVILYWSFRGMVGAGLLMILFSIIAIFVGFRNLEAKYPWFLKLLILSMVLPYIANTGGWLLTEVGRFPWIVYGIFKMENGFSQILTPGTLLISLIGFVLVYGLIILAMIYLMRKSAVAGPVEENEAPVDFTPHLVNPPESH
jgi:cytochrome d ubiquinol oxidase subunit I